MTQESLFSPTQHGELATRLLARRDDPETSKRAARKVAQGAQSPTLASFLELLTLHGPLTCKEAGDKMVADPSYWNAEFNKRVKAWSVAGHIELTGEERDGSRVWRVCE